MVDSHLRGKEIDTSDIKSLIIGGQTGVDGIRFCLASTVNGEDLTDPLFSWFLQFKNKYGAGESVSLSPVYEDNLVKLPWIPGVTATQISGKLQIQVYATKVVGESVVKCWVSEPSTLYVEENLDPTEIAPVEPTVLEQYLTTFTALKNEASGFADEAESWAEEAEDVEVEAGKYSAKHHALKAAQTYSNFDARYLGEKAADPTTDNEGNAIVAGAIYFNTTTSTLRFYSGILWVDAMNGAGDITYNNTSSGLAAENAQDAIDELTDKLFHDPLDQIEYCTNNFTNGRKCETAHELYLAGFYLLSTALGSMDPDDSSKYIPVHVTVSGTEYYGLLSHEWNSGAPRIKFVHSGGTVYFNKWDSSTTVDTSIKSYKGHFRNLSLLKDLRYDLPSSLVAMYSAGDQRNSLRYYDVQSVANEVLGDNLVDITNLSEWSGVSGSLSLSGSVMVITLSGAGSYGYAYHPPVTAVGKLYKRRVKFRVTNSDCSLIRNRIFNVDMPDINQYSPVQDTWYELEGYVYGTGTPGQLLLHHQYADATTASGKVMEVEYYSIQEVLSGDITGNTYVEEAHDIVGTNDASQATESYQPSIVDGAFLTDGSDDYISSIYGAMSTWTIGVKIQATEYTALSFGYNSDYRISLYSNAVWMNDGITGFISIASSPFTQGYRYIISYDGETLRYFINGVEQVLSTQPASGALSFSNSILRIGSSSPLGGSYRITKLKSISVFNTALTPTEVAQLDAILEAE
ncbi:MAG: hypothetical protein ACPKOP_04000 [Sphaerochaetaceae bacterium]